MGPVQNLWLHDMLLKSFLKNGFSKTNGNKSWELNDLQLLFLTSGMAKNFIDFTSNPLYRKQFFTLEVSMIHNLAKEIAKVIGDEPFNLIDIWCGDGLKAVELIKALNSVSDKPIPINYCPINASEYLTDLAISNMDKANLPNAISYKAFLSSCDGYVLRDIGKKLRTSEFTKNVSMLTGGVIACYEINSYLFELSRDFNKGDVLIMGNGVRTGDRLVEIDKYKSEGFNNWLKHLMFGLGFSQENIEFDARFGNSRIELLYKLKTDAVKRIDGKKIEFKVGDEFVVAALYKYYAEEFDKFCSMYFSRADVTIDKDKGYALVICVK